MSTSYFNSCASRSHSSIRAPLLFYVCGVRPSLSYLFRHIVKPLNHLRNPLFLGGLLAMGDMIGSRHIARWLPRGGVPLPARSFLIKVMPSKVVVATFRTRSQRVFTLPTCLSVSPLNTYTPWLLIMVAMVQGIHVCASASFAGL
jgi:hypothetical protein